MKGLPGNLHCVSADQPVTVPGLGAATAAAAAALAGGPLHPRRGPHHRSHALPHPLHPHGLLGGLHRPAWIQGTNKYHKWRLRLHTICRPNHKLSSKFGILSCAICSVTLVVAIGTLLYCIYVVQDYFDILKYELKEPQEKKNEETTNL